MHTLFNYSIVNSNLFYSKQALMKQLHFEPSPFQDLASMLLVMLITNQLQTFHLLVNLHLHQSNLDACYPVSAKTLCQHCCCAVDIKMSDTRTYRNCSLGATNYSLQGDQAPLWKQMFRKSIISPSPELYKKALSYNTI